MPRPRRTSFISIPMADYLATRREVNGNTIAHIARFTGLKSATILRAELGNCRILNSTRDSICQAYGVTWLELREIDHEHNRRLGKARGIIHTMRRVYARPNLMRRFWKWLGQTRFGRFCSALDLS